MASITTEGLVLKRSNFGEADRVLTVLTDRFGKISVIARGVRKITSRRAGNIEVLNRVKLHLFKAKSYTLTEAEAIDVFPIIKNNLTLSTTAFHIIELIDRLLPEEQKNPKVYELTVATLQILEKNPRQIFIRAFEVKLLSILGFWGEKAIEGLTYEQQYLLENLKRSTWSQIAEMEMNESQALALEQILHGFSEKIMESPLKSADVLRDIRKK